MRCVARFPWFLHRVWTDEAGFVVSAELVLVSSLLVVGLITGLTSLRNQVVQELADVGQAIGSLNQSYAFSGICKPCVAWTGGSFYLDKIDFCQDGNTQVPGTEPGGLNLRCWPEGIPRMPTCGELGFGFGKRAFASREASLWAEFPACYVRADVRVEEKKAALVEYNLIVSIDAAKYDAFQARLVQQLDSMAIRKGQWSAPILPRKDALPVQQGCLPPGCQYEGVVDVKVDQGFHSGDWGTDQADLGRETVILVNTLRDQGSGQFRWAWFNVPRPERSLRSGLEVKVEFLGTDGRLIGQDVVPVCVGYNWSPPGLEVFDLYNRRESDFRTLQTLGGKNRESVALAIAERQRDPQRPAEDLLVMVSPYLALPNGGDPPCSYATRLVIPLAKKLAPDQVGKLKEIRATVLGCECVGVK